MVIYRHSHVPKSEVTQGVVYFNPGSSGPRRFKLPVIPMGKLAVDSGQVMGEIVDVAALKQ